MRTTHKSHTTSKGNTALLFNRYMWLVDTIHRAGHISFDAISDRWEQSPLNDTGEKLPLKTFHNHRKAIQEMFDINIECDRRAGYLYFIEHAEDLQQDSVRTWLLNTFAVAHRLMQTDDLKQRILLEEIPSGQRFLVPIIDSMRHNRTLMLTYHSFWHNTAHTFEIAPYCVKVFHQRWYVVALSLGDNRIRIYALDRIQALDTTEHAFTLPNDFDPQAYFSDAFGVIVDTDCRMERIRIRVKGMQRQYLRTLPLHTSQQEIAITDDASVFEFHLPPTLDFQQELLTHAVNAASEIEVLEPQWLRQHMQEIGADLYRIHRD